MASDVTTWKQDRIRAALDLLAIFMSKGYSDMKISSEMDLETSEISQLKGILLHEVGDMDFKDNPHRAYLSYKLRQEGIIKELEMLSHRLKNEGQPNAELGSIRARSDIIDKIMKSGQELGVIPREPKKHQILGGIAITEMTPDDLYKMLNDNSKRMTRLQSRYGSGKYIETEE